MKINQPTEAADMATILDIWWERFQQILMSTGSCRDDPHKVSPQFGQAVWDEMPPG